MLAAVAAALVVAVVIDAGTGRAGAWLTFGSGTDVSPGLRIVFAAMDGLLAVLFAVLLVGIRWPGRLLSEAHLLYESARAIAYGSVRWQLWNLAPALLIVAVLLHVGVIATILAGHVLLALAIVPLALAASVGPVMTLEPHRAIAYAHRVCAELQVRARSEQLDRGEYLRQTPSSFKPSRCARRKAFAFANRFAGDVHLQRFLNAYAHRYDVEAIRGLFREPAIRYLRRERHYRSNNTSSHRQREPEHVR